MPSTSSTSTPTGTPTAKSPPTTLVGHWSAEVETYTALKNTADKAKQTSADDLADAKVTLAAEDKALTDLTKDLAITRAALAKADMAEMEVLGKQVSALTVRQHDSEGRRLERARELDEAQVEADVAADQFSDAAAGLGEAEGKLTAAQAAQKKRDELIASKDKAPFKDAVARAGKDGAELLKKAKARTAVIPQTLRDEAKKRFDAEVQALEKAAAAAAAAEDAVGPADAAGGGVDAVVAAKRRAFGRAEEALRTCLESTVAEVSQALVALAKVAGKENDPPLLTDKEKERIELAAGAATSSPAPYTPTTPTSPSEPPMGYEQEPAPDAATGGEAQAKRGSSQTASVTRPAKAAQPIESPNAGATGGVTAQELIELGRTAYETARAYHELLAAKKQAAKPGADPDSDPDVKTAREDCDKAATAYAEAVKAFQARPADYVPDKVWQAVLDVWTAERSLIRAQDTAALALLVDALKPDKPEKPERQLVQALGQGADHRREAERLKYEARRRVKLLEKAQSAHSARLFARVRGDF